MPLQRVPTCLRTLLCACCILPLAGCDTGTRDMHAGGAIFSLQPLAERELHHFDVYLQYRAVFDRPRRALVDALQDDVELPPMDVRFLSGAGVCSTRGVAAD